MLVAPIPNTRSSNLANEESGALFWLIVAILVFIVSGLISWREMKYQLYGETTEAVIKRVIPVKHRDRGRDYTVYHVRYMWTQRDGVKREDVDDVGTEWNRPASDTIRIDFLSGEQGSRLSGDVNYFALVYFYGSAAIMIVVFVLTARKAYK